MAAIRAAIFETLAADNPMTVRQVFYQLTSRGVIPKTETEYNRTVVRLLGEMRRAGELPYEWLADSTRWMRKPTTYSSAEEALRNTAKTYRRDLWNDGPEYVEIWLEKEALAGVLVEVTDVWDVPLMVTRGYSSMSFLYSAALTIKARSQEGKSTRIYYFGDRDPSGVDIDRAIRQGIGESLGMLGTMMGGPRAMAWDMIVGGLGLDEDEDPEEAAARKEETFADYATFERVAVTEEQIVDWELQTRPTKKKDTRAKKFKGESVELDAIPSAQLRALAEEIIERNVDRDRLKVLQVAEEEERRGLEQIAATFNGDGEYAWEPHDMTPMGLDTQGNGDGGKP